VIATQSQDRQGTAGSGGARAADTIEPRLAVHELAFRYREREVLRQVSFQVAPGEILGLLGPNGAGKSTLFSILAGLLAPASGRLLVDGAEIAFGARSLRARMGVVFQSPSLDAKLTAEENLILGGRLFGLGRRVARARSRELLEKGGLLDRAREPAGKLSGGLRRRLELARALVHRPAILLMDEPTSGLDAHAFRQTWAAVHALRRDERITVLLTTHRPDEAEACDRLAVLDAGRVIATGSPEELRSRVAGDVVTVEAEDPRPLAAEIAHRLGLVARSGARSVHIARERGHELVPRLVEAFPAGRIRSVSVRRPTLADAFLAITGQDLEGDTGSPRLEKA
jgi:ABC-2 type transport system ATP-binding protein